MDLRFWTRKTPQKHSFRVSSLVPRRRCANSPPMTNETEATAMQDETQQELPKDQEETHSGEQPQNAATDTPEARIAALEAERDDFRERWMRAEAEMANVRTRAKRDADDARNYAVQKFAADIVEAAENLRRGLSALPAAEEGEPASLTRVREGLEGVERNFISILERNGISGTDPTGAVFDPNLHQAMSEQPSAEHPPGTVIQAWTSAWTLNGRLLKPAMVVVAKA
ncbi:GrpE protein [Granulibacter bethesdensis]|nr:GrpE protein [Granulibacter bethesdensis]